MLAQTWESTQEHVTEKKCDEGEAKSPVMTEEDRDDLRALNTFTRVAPESRRQINLEAYLDLWYFFYGWSLMQLR